MKLLLDTNIAIALEDPKPVKPTAAAFAERCERFGLTRFVADANYADIKRDTDEERRVRTISKLDKFPRLKNVAIPSAPELTARFGEIKNPHDQCDVELLAILDADAVDLLISGDTGIKRRAERAGLGSRVLDIGEALSWLRQSYEPLEVQLPYIDEVAAYEIDINDVFFDSLRTDYPEFPTWFRKKCINEHRRCWTVKLDGRLAGLVIRKEEPPDEADCTTAASKILKISTFKMSPDFQGEKFGEQLLKQVLWWAQSNLMEVVYLTAYEKQTALISLLQRYGFEHTRTLDTSELVLEKQTIVGPLPDNRDSSGAIAFARRHYPRYYDGPNARKFVVPIKPAYHAVLFPEIDERVIPEQEQLQLFGSLGDSNTNRIPGNTIQKVYVCRAKTRQLRPGDLVFFYATKDVEYVRSQTITSIGVVEAVQDAKNVEDLIRLTAKRSVYSIEQLRAQFESNDTPVKVIDFLLVAHMEEPIALQKLTDMGIFVGHPPQTISRLPDTRYRLLCQLIA